MTEKTSSGIIFDIQRFSLHDGPGTRTNIYFKGCPLSCIWCANPESHRMVPEYYFFRDRCDDDCLLCVEKCSRDAINKAGGRLYFDLSRCDGCDDCVDTCNNDAIKRVGRYWQVDDVLNTALKDIKIYNKSGGGITFTGGEATYQPGFLRSLVKEFKKYHIHTCIETCGHFDFENSADTLQDMDLILFDLKIIKDADAKRLTGKGSDLIIQNLERIVREINSDLIIRVPLVPSLTSTSKNLSLISSLIRGLDPTNLKGVELLPYHKLGLKKYDLLGREPGSMKIPIPSSEEINEAKDFFKGLNIKIIR